MDVSKLKYEVLSTNCGNIYLFNCGSTHSHFNFIQKLKKGSRIAHKNVILAITNRLREFRTRQLHVFVEDYKQVKMGFNMRLTYANLKENSVWYSQKTFDHHALMQQSVFPHMKPASLERELTSRNYREKGG